MFGTYGYIQISNLTNLPQNTLYIRYFSFIPNVFFKIHSNLSDLSFASPLGYYELA